jgi:hypothetical protein
MSLSIYPSHLHTLLPWSLALMASVAAAQPASADQAEFAGGGLPTWLQYQSVLGGYERYVDRPVESLSLIHI